MESIADIKNRRKSVVQTRQITKAMQMISTSKMKKAYARYEANVDFMRKLRESIKDIVMHTKVINHRYLEQRTGRRAAYVVISADKGLAGAYNHNVLNLALKHMLEYSNERFIFTVGQVGREFFERKGYMVDVDFLYMSQNPTLRNAHAMTLDILDLYDRNLLDEVYVVYTQMDSPTKQVPRVMKILPLSVSIFEDVSVPEDQEKKLLEFLPDVKSVLEMVIPNYIVGLMYIALSQSSASEHSARMIAMENATNNADRMLDKLDKDFNRARQYAITQEISEIMAGAKSLMLD